MVYKLSPVSDGDFAVSSPRARPRQASIVDQTVASPALALQDVIAASSDVTEPRRWSARRTFAFVVLVNGVAWFGVAAAVRAIF